MLPYLLVLSFVIFWIVLEKQALNRKSFWVPLIVLSLFAGIRSFRVGTDSWNYTRDFRSSLDVYNFQFNEFCSRKYKCRNLDLPFVYLLGLIPPLPHVGV